MSFLREKKNRSLVIFSLIIIVVAGSGVLTLMFFAQPRLSILDTGVVEIIKYSPTEDTLDVYIIDLHLEAVPKVTMASYIDFTATITGEDGWTTTVVGTNGNFGVTKVNAVIKKIIDLPKKEQNYIVDISIVVSVGTIMGDDIRETVTTSFGFNVKVGNLPSLVITITDTEKDALVGDTIEFEFAWVVSDADGNLIGVFFVVTDQNNINVYDKEFLLQDNMGVFVGSGSKTISFTIGEETSNIYTLTVTAIDRDLHESVKSKTLTVSWTTTTTIPTVVVKEEEEVEEIEPALASGFTWIIFLILIPMIVIKYRRKGKNERKQQ